ncbi:MAG: HypC/HybG/HupF family hydrogenase formation chaperone [Defluviitaleaceae bacterium]|nr:HypC/HybG/HupF family hydrogenase formation chaperone [Defluviitaleaceae bacterium]
MCIAVPMKIISIDEQTRMGKVLFSGNELSVNLALISPKIGDYVLIHAGCAIEIVKEDEAEEIIDIFNMLEDGAPEVPVNEP